MVTLKDLKEAKEYFNRFEHIHNGVVYVARQMGKVKTWKREPDKFLIPVKYGLYDSFYIANFDGIYNKKHILNNAKDWKLI